jgi:hypothetical protein
MSRLLLFLEDKAGRTPLKLGFVIINLSEFAASGNAGIKQSFLLDGYSGSQRQDNSRIHVEIKMAHQGADPLFKVPTSAMCSSEEAALNPADRKAPSATPSTSARLEDGHKANGDNVVNIYRDVEERTMAMPSVSTNNYPERQSWHGSGTYDGSVERRTGVGTSTASSALRRMSDDRIGSGTNRVQRTRRDAEDVIEEVLAETGLDKPPTEDEDESQRRGLTLFVSKDGEAAVIGQSSSPTSAGAFERVNIDTTLSN